MNNSDLSDERLVFLHQQKKLNAFFIIYERYKNYGYSIIYRKLSVTPYLNALIDEKNAILYESIMDAFSSFNGERGSFRCLLSSIIEHRTLNLIRRYRNNPIADCLYLDETIDDSEDIKLEDTIIFADSYDSPRDFINDKERYEKLTLVYQGHDKDKIKKIIQLRKQGYKIVEIAYMLNSTPKAIRSILYRIRKKVDKKKKSELNR